jgi:subtilisin family serine protease
MPKNPYDAYGAVEDYRLDELAVALPDLDVVEKALKDLHVTTHRKDSDKRLGLALLGLREVTKAAARQQRKDPGLIQRVKDRKWRGRVPQQTGSLDLDVLLYKLRQNIADKNDGWIPEIGKNRLISPVRGFPYVSGCARGNPEQFGLDDPNPQLAAGESLGWPEPRPTEPGHSIRVGLLDTQLYPQEWLQGGYLATEKDLLTYPAAGGSLQALEGHGTFIAGLILKQAPGAKLVVRPVMGHRAVGKAWGVAKVMAEFVGTGVHVLNLSFGCYTDDGEPPLVLAKAVSLVSPQILLVAAAGNHGDIDEMRNAGDPLADPKKVPWTASLTDKTPVWPAAFAEVTAVGATDGSDKRATFSPKAPWVDVTAPGVDVESTYLEGQVSLSQPSRYQREKFNGYARWQGTSFAAATVSGAVAAQIGSGCDARQALETVLKERIAGIKRFKKRI